MSSSQTAIDCPNPACGAPAALGLCTRFANGFGLQLGPSGAHAARWDDTHCLVCGHFSSPYARTRLTGSDLQRDADWLAAVDRALFQVRAQHAVDFLAARDMGVYDLIAMRRAVVGLRNLEQMAASSPTFPQVGVLRVRAEAQLPEVFGVAHGEAESEPFARKVRVLGRLLGAASAETTPRHCMSAEPRPAWYFYDQSTFIGLLCLEPNRRYRGHVTIDGCLDRLFHGG